MAKRLRKWVWVLAILFLLIGAPLILLRGSISTIDMIRCKTQYAPCDETDEGKLKEFYGQNLFLLSGRRVESRMKADFQNRSVSVQKVFPKELVVILDKRKPFVALEKEGLAGVFLLDQDGVVVSFVNKSSLPILVLWKDANLTIGEMVEEKIKQAALLLFMTNRTQQGNVGDYENQKDDFFTVLLPNNVKVYFPLGRDPSVSIGALQLILTRSRIDGKIPGSIDLRYSNPVLRY
ncbi:MAG: hypothetical protein Q7S60_00540 [bacterium]|nr:hypothetical protein [bacterium]